jgi:hypothetical protein
MLPLIQRALAVISEVLGIVQQLMGIAQKTAQEHQTYAIETNTDAIGRIVDSPTFGNEPIMNTLLDVLSAVDVPNATVILPTTPPAGYGGASASGVWAEPVEPMIDWQNDVDMSTPYWQIVQAAEGGMLAAGLSGVVDGRNPAFSIVSRSANELHNTFFSGVWNGNQYDVIAPVDWSTWLPGEDIVTFLNRVTTTTNPWTHVGPWTGVTCASAYTRVDSAGYFWYRCNYLNWMQPLMTLASGLGAIRAAPVWPGVANVTLGTPVSIANGASSSEACDGVIVAITGVPTGQGSYTFGTHESYVHLGQLAFVDDNGEYEDSQSFTFEASILTPKRMAHASGFVIRCRASVVGTVTPWVTA